MKVFISYPPFNDKGVAMLTQNRQFQWFSEPSYLYPLVPAMAATVLKEAGHDVHWNDAIVRGWDFEQFFAYFKEQRPDMVIMESKTPVIKKHWRLVKEMKGMMPECKFVLMGDHTTAKPAESLEHCPVDYVFTGGNYDVTARALCNHLEGEGEMPPGVWYRNDRGEIVHTGDFELNFDLNELPFHDRDLTVANRYFEKWKKYDGFYYTMVGRDCPYAKCTFCSWTVTHPRFKTRRPELLLDEIGYLIEEHGAQEIFDDTGTFPAGSWLKKFCDGMIDRGYHKKVLVTCNMRFDYIKNPEIPVMMKKAGFRKIKSGIESANQRSMDILAKGISLQDVVTGCKNASKAGLEVHLTTMVGYHWESREEAQNTINFAKDLMKKGYAEMLQATVVVPYVGTGLYYHGLEHDAFRFDPFDYDRYDMTEPAFKTPDMTPEEVMAMANSLYKNFLDPRFVARKLLSIRSWNDVSYVARGAKAVIGHLKDFSGVRSHADASQSLT